jgi:hypothetical protein
MEPRIARTTACSFLWSRICWSRIALGATAVALGCAGEARNDPPRDAGSVVLPGPAPAVLARYGSVWAMATHNSYWVDRGTKDDTFASGTNLRLIDQLVAGRARSLEIDLHRDPTVPARFRVYHTVPGNGLCDDLRDCLAQVRLFHRALPRHEPLNLTLELKELFASSFDDTHTIEDLDRVLREELPGLLYSPADFLARCDRDSDAAGVARDTLSACAARKDWPGIDELRGKVVVTVLGNWDDLGAAQATSDWVRYATKDDVRSRVAFPMASSWKLRWEDLTLRVQELVTQRSLDDAFAQSIFLQIESLDDPRIASFLARHGIIRVDGANSKDDQSTRIDRGMQLMQTDTPFVRFGDDQPQVAVVPFDRTLPTMPEPGSRLLLFPSGTPTERVFAWTKLPDTTTATTTWEALVASGQHDVAGCLRVAGDDTPGTPSFSVCRMRVDAPVPSTDALHENALIEIEVCSAGGACTLASHASKEPALGGFGDLIQLVVRRAFARTCVRARSTDFVSRVLEPSFVDVGDEVCFDAALSRIGLARIPAADRHGGVGPAWFVDARRDGAAITAGMLTVSIEGATSAGRPDETKLVDATVP